MIHVWHWFLHISGADDESGPWYGFWSGFGSDLAEFSFVAVLCRKFNCHTYRCWRIGLHRVAGTPHVTCRKHHPTLTDAPVTAEDIADAHRAAQEGDK